VYLMVPQHLFKLWGSL